jgi:hypothetical protein
VSFLESSNIAYILRLRRTTRNRAGDVPDLTADPALAEAELSFTAPRDLETMCRDLWNWQTMNPQGYDTPEQTPVAELTGQVTETNGVASGLVKSRGKMASKPNSPSEALLLWADALCRV